MWARRVAMAIALLLPGAVARADLPEVIKVGILNDMNGPFADQSGRGSVVAAQLAAEEFAAQGGGLKVQILSADHLNKPDTGAQIVREWVDRDGVAAVADAVNSGVGLAVNTVMGRDKTLNAVEGLCLDEPIHGFEMHMGVTDGPDRARPFCTLAGQPDGAVSADGSVMGGYLHGLFAADGFRRKFLNRFAQGAASDLAYETRVETVLDDLAAHLETHLDLDRLLTLAER